MKTAFVLVFALSIVCVTSMSTFQMRENLEALESKRKKNKLPTM